MRAPFRSVTNARLRADVRNEMTALRGVTLSTTGPRVSATAATAAAITAARARRGGWTRPKDHIRRLQPLAGTARPRHAPGCAPLRRARQRSDVNAARI